MSGRKSISKVRLKATSKEERFRKLKEDFKNLIGNILKLPKIINGQVDIRLRQFTGEQLDTVFKKVENRKAAELDEITTEVWKTRKFDRIPLRLYDPVNLTDDLRITKNYSGITLTAMAAKVYITLLLNLFDSKSRKF